MVLLVAGLQLSRGWALLGPLGNAPGGEAWQTITIAYGLGTGQVQLPGGPVFLGDLGGPHNLAEEYRRDTPVMYYTFDQTFLNFFGTYGASAVDGAYAIMNSVPAADKMDLSQYPLQAMQVNYTAQSLHLTDLKSVTLHLLVEQMGLADPERFVFTLHDRYAPPGCPLTTEYLVVQRNFDYQTSPLTQTVYSPYVNGVFYSYYITEICTPGPILAYTVPFSTDLNAELYTSVAANNYDGNFAFIGDDGLPHNTSGGLEIGRFYTGLTRDDMAGLKYLYTTNNVNLELPDPTGLLFTATTNMQLQVLFPNGAGTNNVSPNGGFYYFDGNFGYGDYSFLVGNATTNSPAVLQALYPGLVIASSSNYFVIATNWIYYQYFTNSGIGSPYPPVITLVTASNPQPYLLEKFVTKFANVFTTKHYSPNTTIQQQTVTVTPNYGAPYPSAPLTNITTKTITYAGHPSGDFFVLPLFHTNVCPLDILYTGLTNVLRITNVLTSFSTNFVTISNTSLYSSQLIQVYAFTNYTFVINPVTCAETPNVPNYYQGIGKVKFVREDYDSLIGQFFQPATNYYSMVALTNYQWQLQRFVRVVTRPDVLMDARDLFHLILPDNTLEPTVTRSISFTPSPILNGLAGPGTINTPSTFTYNKIGDSAWNGYTLNAYYNNPANFLWQYGEIPSLAWASFDGSTNAPVVYPNGTSIATLEAILAFRFTPNQPPDGYVNATYSQTFAVGGGLLQAPLNWSASGLPPGMNISNAPNGTDFIISGTPTASGTFDFVLQLTDATGRSVQWHRTITIH